MSNRNTRKSYYNRVYQEYQVNGWDFDKLVGRYKPDTIINNPNAYEVFKNRVIKDRKFRREREKIEQEYKEIQAKSKQKGYEIRQKQYEKIDKMKIQNAEKKGVINRNNVFLNKKQVKQLKNIYTEHKELYKVFKEKLVEDYGFNSDDIALLEGEILQSNKGNTFQLPINVKGFKSFENLINSFTLQGNVDNLIKIYKKDIESLENNRMTINDRIEGKDFITLFEQLHEDRVISEGELIDLTNMIKHTRFTTKEAIRNHFGKLTNLIESDPKTGVKIKNYYSTLKNWINLFDKADYTVRK
ncbi:hypothetical protein susfortuna_gp9 [Clostridium phage susfortuna]|uniref:Uncharacterized protein n=1 Tax=Clostridium phage susfortuna TaxID=2316154 RepID=A0A385IRI0_9CAUD|nr:hypothetical protein HWB67_gp09 [Clostridium phage susfortuna]AXY86149.1 hypothetical protein susfortuna_gp9 [Clostridium phage susfortuna]